MTLRTLLSVFVGAALAGGGAWLWLRPVDPLAPIVRRHGPFGPADTTLRVDEVVNDIRALDRVVVFRAYVTATTTTHEVGWFTQTDQTMLTPAFVNYYVDMRAIGPGAIRVTGTRVTVRLPPLMIERPNIDTVKVQVFNQGLWSGLGSIRDRLRVQNSVMAVRQLQAAANQPFLVEAAVRAEAVAVGANVRVALAAAGHRDVGVEVMR